MSDFGSCHSNSVSNCLACAKCLVSRKVCKGVRPKQYLPVCVRSRFYNVERPHQGYRNMDRRPYNTIQLYLFCYL